MKWQELEQLFPTQTHFSSQQLRIFFPRVTSQYLDYRQATGKIDQIKRGWYRINGRTNQEEDMREIANHIYEPSYVSLETALRYYNFIPEIVPSITSISSRKTNRFVSDVGIFSYQTIALHMFRWYHLLPYRDRNIIIADPEKALLDYLYYHDDLHSIEAFDEWRIDISEVLSRIDKNKLIQYSTQCPKKAVQYRVSLFISYIYDNVT